MLTETIFSQPWTLGLAREAVNEAFAQNQEIDYIQNMQRMIVACNHNVEMFFRDIYSKRMEKCLQQCLEFLKNRYINIREAAKQPSYKNNCSEEDFELLMIHYNSRISECLTLIEKL